MKKKILVLDCDGILFDSLKLIDEQVETINYMGSDSYKNDITQRIDERDRNFDLWNERLRLHYIIKDQILEEVFPKYQNRINYDVIYQFENTFDGVIEEVKKIWNSGLFSQIYVLSHVNSVNEVRAKRRFFEEYLPMVNVITVPFHREMYYRCINKEEEIRKNSDRVRTNKVNELKDILELEDLSSVYFIDDTRSICEEAVDLGATAVHCGKNEQILEKLRQVCRCAYQELLDSYDKEDNKTLKKRR